MDSQDSPHRTHRTCRSRRARPHQLALGIVFLCVGVGLLVGPGAAGVPFLVLGLVFLSTGVTRRVRR